MDQPLKAVPQKLGGRPSVSPNEPSVRVGPFTINQSLSVWLRCYADEMGKSQGEILREALRRLQSSIEGRRAA